MVNRNCKERTSSIALNNCGETITSPTAVANIFNEHFSTIGQSDLSSSCKCLKFEESSAESSFMFEPFTGLEVLRTIKSLNNSKSCGEDGISNQVFEKCSFYVVDILVYLFNASVFSATFPHELKCSVVIPLYKRAIKRQEQLQTNFFTFLCI